MLNNPEKSKDKHSNEDMEYSTRAAVLIFRYLRDDKD